MGQGSQGWGVEEGGGVHGEGADMAGCPHQQDDGNDSHLCLHESWQPGEDAFVSDHDITRGGCCSGRPS